MGKAERVQAQTPILKLLNEVGVGYKISSPTRGVPDIVGVVDGVAIWVETKTPRGDTSPLQRYQISQLRANKAVAIVCDNLADFVLALEDISADFLTKEQVDIIHSINKRSYRKGRD